MRWLLLLLVFRGICLSAPPIKLIINVIDSSTSAGVPRAGITLIPTKGSDVPDNVPDTDFGGRAGVNVEQNSSFVIHVMAAGYAEKTSALLTARTNPLSVTLTLDRAATLFGHVIDADSGKPIPDMPVWVMQVSYTRGAPLLTPASAPMSTDTDGRFEAKGLFAGDYIVETNFYWDSPKQAFSPKQSYGRQVWPGGRDILDASPLSIPAGAVFDFGTISLAKRTLANVSFRIVGDCAGQSFDVRLVQFFARGGLDRAVVKSAECDKPGSFSQVSPGGYSMVASPSDAQTARPDRIAQTWIDVTDTDIAADLVLRPTPEVNIHGRVVMDSAAMRGVSLSFLTVSSVFQGLAAGMSLTPGSADVDANGSFATPIYIPPAGKIAVRAAGLPPSFYLEALRYNGARIDGDEFALNEFAVTQDLEIICSSRFGIVSGQVFGNELPLVDILLVPWPNSGVNYPANLAEAHGSPDGKFTFSPVRPGRYKVIAVRSAERQKFESPFRLMKELPGGSDVDVASGSGTSIRIEKLTQ